MDYYKRIPLTVPELTTFLDGVGHEAIAVSLNSKAGMKPGDYVEMLEAPVGSAGARRRGSSQQERLPVPPGGDPHNRRGIACLRGGRRSAGSVRSTTAPAHDAPSPQWRSRWAALAGLMMVLLGLGLD